MPNRVTLLSTYALIADLKARLAVLQEDAREEMHDPKGGGLMFLRGQIGELLRTIETIENMILSGEVQGTPREVKL